MDKNKIQLDEEEKLVIAKFMDMSQEQFETYVDDGEHSAFEVIALWKFAKIKVQGETNV